MSGKAEAGFPHRVATNRKAPHIEMFAALMIGPHLFNSLAM
jgi:hypothetical protein